MKKIIFTLLLIASAKFLSAQDVITLKNGSELKVKILQITLSEITCKLYNNQSGPEITFKLSDIKSFRYDERSLKEKTREDSVKNIPNNQNDIGDIAIETNNLKPAVKRKRRLTFGFSLGMDIANWWNSVKFVDLYHNVLAGNNIYMNLHPDGHVAFGVGFELNYRFKPWLEMQSEINLLGKGQSCEGDGNLKASNGAQTTVHIRETWAVNYLQIPVIMRFINKKKLFLGIGPHLSILTGSKIKLRIDPSTTQPDDVYHISELRPINTGMTAAAGIQTRWICIEFRYLLDFLDVFNKGNFDFNIRNQVFQLICSVNFGR
jgi:hypothetical protein